MPLGALRACSQSPTATQQDQWRAKHPPWLVTSAIPARKKQRPTPGTPDKQTGLSSGLPHPWEAGKPAGPPLTKKARYRSRYTHPKPPSSTPRGPQRREQPTNGSRDTIKYIEELLYGVDDLEPDPTLSGINWDLDQLGIAEDSHSASDIADCLRTDTESRITKAKVPSKNGEVRLNIIEQLLVNSSRVTPPNLRLCSKFQAGKPKFAASRFLKSPAGVLHIKSSASVWKTPFTYPRLAWYEEDSAHTKRNHAAPPRHNSQTDRDPRISSQRPYSPALSSSVNEELYSSSRWQNLYSLGEDTDEDVYSPLTISTGHTAQYRGFKRSTSVNSYCWSDDSCPPRRGHSMESAILGSEEMLNRYVQSARRESQTKGESLQKYKIRERMKSLEEGCLKNENPNLCNYCEKVGLKKRVVAYCYHCRKRMCKVCCSDHENDALTISHAVVDLTALSQSAII